MCGRVIGEDGGDDLRKVADLCNQTIVILRRDHLRDCANGCDDVSHGCHGFVRSGIDRTEEIWGVAKQVGIRSLRSRMFQPGHWVTAYEPHTQRSSFVAYRRLC